MSFNIVSLVMQHLGPEVVAKIARALGLESHLASRAIGALVPGMLGSLASGTSTAVGAAHLAGVLDSIDPNSLGGLAANIGGPNQATMIGSGNALVGLALGGPASDSLASSFSRFAGIDGLSANALTGIVGTSVLGSLAALKRSQGLDAPAMASVFAGQVSNIQAALPAGFNVGATPSTTLAPSHGTSTSHGTAAGRSGYASAAAPPMSRAIESNPSKAWLGLLPLGVLLIGGIWYLAGNVANTRRVVAEQQRVIAEKIAADAKAKAEAEARAKAEAEAKARAEAEAARAKAEAEARARAEAEAARVRAEAEAKARAEAEAARVKAEAEAKARADAEAADKARLEAEAKITADAAAATARAEAEAKARSEAEAKQRADAETAAKVRADAEAAAARARTEADAKQRAEADAAKARAEADAKARADAEARQRAEAEAKRRADADAATARAKADAEAKQKADAEAKQRADAAAARPTPPVAPSTPVAPATVAVAKACEADIKQLIAAGSIRFRISSATIQPDSAATLNKIAAAINGCPGTSVRVEGHTDSDGEAQDNLDLSNRRAKAVQDFLVKAGVTADRLSSAGLGQSKPLVPNDTAENKLKNRRTEIIDDPK